MPSKYIFTATKKDNKYYIMYLFCLQKSYDGSILPKIEFTDIKDKNNKPIPYNLEPSTPNENPNTVDTGSISTTKLPTTKLPTIKLINNSNTIVTFSENNLKWDTINLNEAIQSYDNELNKALQFIIDYLKQKKTDYENEIKAIKIETQDSAAKKKVIEDKKKVIEDKKKVIEDEIIKIENHIKEKIKADDNLFKPINKIKQTTDDELFKAIKNKKDVYSNYEINVADAKSTYFSVTSNPKSSDSDKETARGKLAEAEGAKTSADKKLAEAQDAKISADKNLAKAQGAKTSIDDKLIDDKLNTQKAINDIINNFNIDDLPNATIKSNFTLAKNGITSKTKVVTANEKLKETIVKIKEDDIIFKKIKNESADKFNLSNRNNEWDTYFNSYYYRPQLFLLDNDISNISIKIGNLDPKQITIPIDSNIQIIQIDDFFDPPAQKCGCTIC